MAKTQSLEQEVRDYVDTLEQVAQGLFDGYQYEDWYDAIAAYFDNPLDVEFIIGVNGEYRGAIVTLELGRYIITYDTRDGVVTGKHHWGDSYRWQIESNEADILCDYFHDQWESARGY